VAEPTFRHPPNLMASNKPEADAVAQIKDSETGGRGSENESIPIVPGADNDRYSGLI